MRIVLSITLYLLALAPIAAGQVGVPPSITVEHGLDTGWVSNDGEHEQVIIAFPVWYEAGRSLRLYFDQVTLAGNPADGSGSILRVTSLRDGGQQTLNAEHARQWRNSTAYFNGESVMVEVIAQPHSGPNRLVLRSLEVGLPFGSYESQCGPSDDRVPSSDPRVGRLMPVVCTTWMIDDCNHCFLSAGHCVGSIDTVQFNVPLSSGGGSLNHPGPQDQYAVDSSSIQSNGGQGTGNDWAYFGCFPNSVTGLAPADAMGSFFTLQSPPPLFGNTIRITGYGADSGSANFTQQTHSGPFVTDSGTLLGYQADTQGGNSGSPVIWNEQDVAIGIHTHGGCSSGSNKGTDVMNHNALQNAISNPLGICAQCGPPTIASLSPDTLSPLPVTVLTITGNNLSGTQNVTIGSTVYLPGDFISATSGQIQLLPDLPGALGVEPVLVTNSQGTSNALDLTWVATDPPFLSVPGFGLSSRDLEWSYAGGSGDTAYLIIAFSPATFPFGGFDILATPIILKVSTLDAVGMDGLTLLLPAASSGVTFYSQVVTFSGSSIAGASSTVMTWVVL